MPAFIKKKINHIIKHLKGEPIIYVRTESDGKMYYAYLKNGLKISSGDIETVKQQYAVIMAH